MQRRFLCGHGLSGGWPQALFSARFCPAKANNGRDRMFAGQNKSPRFREGFVDSNVVKTNVWRTEERDVHL